MLVQATWVGAQTSSDLGASSSQVHQVSDTASVDAHDTDIESPSSYPSIRSVLNNVVSAGRYYSYTGLLTYEANGSLSTLRLYQQIDHSDDSPYVYQTLEFLDGVNRRVVREQELKSCDLGQTRWGLWPHQFNADALERFYKISIQGAERVASRNTWIVDLVPKDGFRYGYRFNVDQQTGLLLRYAVIEKGGIIERTQFVTLELHHDINDQPSASEGAISWRVPEVEPCHTEQYQSAWKVDWLPEGFLSAGNRVTAQGEQVLMFSDGLVSISVFITSNQGVRLPKLTARRGATIAVMSPVVVDNSKMVAVVGEVPIVTARRIAVSVVAQ